MKILLLGNYALDRQESMLRYASTLQVALCKKGHQVTLLQPPIVFGKLTFVGTKLLKWFGYIDKFLIFPLLLRFRKHGFDVIHVCDHSNAMWIPALQGCKYLITCHDLLAVRSALGEFPENPLARTGRFFQSLILLCMKRAKVVVCVSAATRQDVLRIVGLEPRSVHCVYLAPNDAYRPMDPASARFCLDEMGYDSSKPYFMHIGNNSWYKNRRGVLQIFARVIQEEGNTALNLLLFGKPLSEVLMQEIRTLGIRDRVHFYHGISNEQLRAAYSLSEGLIFPSLYEGFGWPILEAHACGCPVYTTGLAPMNEVGGDAAVFFHPRDFDEAAKVIVSSRSRASEMRRLGILQARLFNTQTMIEAYEHIYREL